MKLISLLCFILCSVAQAQRQKIDPISFGGVKLAEERMPIDLDSFAIQSEGTYAVSGAMVHDSLQWVRLDRALLLPRALLEVSFLAPATHRYSWSYADQKVIPLFDPTTGRYTAQIFVSLFESLPLSLTEDTRVVNVVRIIPSRQLRALLIDYSCAPYQVELSGIDNDFISVGCQVQRTGPFGEEKPYLEVLMTSAAYRMKDQSGPPYIIAFHATGAASISLVNYRGEEKVVKVSARVPKNLPRLRLAGGLGPYQLETEDKNGNKRHVIAPTAMLYGNFALNETSSLRFFDSYSRNSATFHNWGTYFAWDLAEFCDQRCVLTSLIGAQGVEFRAAGAGATQSDLILPQGLEFIYKHPFGQLNYKFSYGMFASFSGLYDYQNIWIRYGKSTFWELNYIDWRQDDRRAAMVGLSIGFPLGSFF